nr:MAG TPA: homing endonuclease [Herelleviridae sp.]
MTPKDNEEVDHINRDKNDNRKKNLRTVIHSQNGKNRSRQYNNKSGYTGACFDNTTQKWRARIIINNKVIYLGYYKQLEDAVRVRKEAEIKYYGDFAPKED